MTRFIDTAAGHDWIATGPERETSRAVMRAIAALTADEDEAEAAWADGYTATLSAERFAALLLRWIAENEPADLARADVRWGFAGIHWINDCAGYLICPVINDAGEDALESFLRQHLRCDDLSYLSEITNDLMVQADFSTCGTRCAPQIELRGFYSRDRNPHTYWFGAGEYDLVVYDDDGDEVARIVT